MNLLKDAEIKRQQHILKMAEDCIAKYGTLRYCTAKVCGCIGCVNHSLSKADYEEALTYPEVKKLLEARKESFGSAIGKRRMAWADCSGATNSLQGTKNGN